MSAGLHVQGLRAGYGASQVLQGVDLSVAPGHVVALLGRNGSGRSTLAQALMGLLPAQGCVTWQGQPLLGLPPHRIARRGVGYVPEGRDVFGALTVAQNLALGIQAANARTPIWTPEQVLDRFAVLGQRRDVPAGVLSGGEQQILSLCRALMGAPRLLIVDEPTEGLAPQWVAAVEHILQTLRREGVSVLLIEQKCVLSLTLADRVAVMGRGRVVFDGTARALAEQSDVQREWLEA